MIDFNEMQSLRKPEASKTRRTEFRLRRTERTTGPTFIFSQSLFDDLGLADNSLEVKYTDDAVYIAVHPENGGHWAKKTAKGEKGWVIKVRSLK